MKLNKLTKATTKKKKRIGRGYGSGKGGHTVGRGQKGFKARSKVGLLFSGTKMRKSWIKRLPFVRGKGKFKSHRPQPIIVNVKYLNIFKDGQKVTLKTLVKKGIVAKGAEKTGVKILGDGKLEKKLTVELPVSQGALKKIEKAGGRVVKVAKKAKPAKEKAKEKKTKKKKVKKKKTIKKAKPAKSKNKKNSSKNKKSKNKKS